jgi:DNA-binding transcriptional LysR family regulator
MDNHRPFPRGGSAPFPHLEAFLEVARLRSFSAAARELGVSRSAVSQSIRKLEDELRVALVVRTTRSVSLTDAGKRLVEGLGPAMSQVATALREVSAKPGEAVGRLRLSVPHAALPFVIEPVVPKFRERHPRIDLEIAVEDRLVDLVGEGYDAGVRLNESIERDMLQVRLTDPFRFVVVGAPKYLAKHGTPKKPEDLLRHECITFRSQTTGTLYAWELERGKRTWRVPVRGGIVGNEARLLIWSAERSLGLVYAFEPMVREQLRSGKLQVVLDDYAPTVPGYFLYFPRAARASTPLRLFIDAAKELSIRRMS